MREQLKAYVEQLFDRAADTPRNQELQEEIMQNTLDRYDDLIAQGVPEASAYTQAVSQIGDVSKLWEPGPKKHHGEKKHRHGWARLAQDLTAAAVQMADGVGISIGGCTVRFAEAESYTAGDAAIPAAGIARVKVHWNQGVVSVEPGTGDTIVLSELGVDQPEHRLYWRVRDDTLEIQFVAPGVYRRLPDKALHLTLPDAVSSLDIETVSADLAVSDLPAATLNFETVSGDGDIRGSYASMQWESVSGDLEFRGRAASVRVSTVSGDAKLALTEAPNTLTAEAVSGDLTLFLPDARGFTVRYDTVSGDFTCDLPTRKLGKHHRQFDGAGEPADFRLESVSGDLTIRRA